MATSILQSTFCILLAFSSAWSQHHSHHTLLIQTFLADLLGPVPVPLPWYEMTFKTEPQGRGLEISPRNWDATRYVISGQPTLQQWQIWQLQDRWDRLIYWSILMCVFISFHERDVFVKLHTRDTVVKNVTRYSHSDSLHACFDGFQKRLSQHNTFSCLWIKPSFPLCLNIYSWLFLQDFILMYMSILSAVVAILICFVKHSGSSGLAKW